MDSEGNLIGSAVSIPPGLPRGDMRRLHKGNWSLSFTPCVFYGVTVRCHQYGFSKQIRPRATTNSD